MNTAALQAKRNLQMRAAHIRRQGVQAEATNHFHYESRRLVSAGFLRGWLSFPELKVPTEENTPVRRMRFKRLKATNQ